MKKAKRIWLTAALTSALVAAIWAGTAAARVERAYVETKRAGKIEATFSYREKADWGFENQQLTIRRAGGVVLDKPLRPENGVWPGRIGRSLSLVDLDGGEQEVVLKIFTGGASCCETLHVYRWAGGRYRGSIFNQGQGGFQVINIDRKGDPELLSRDGRFHYLFSSGAESFLPIRIYRFKAGKLVTVTREFPYQLRQAEKRSYQVARDMWGKDYNPHTALAAWAANKYLLGEGADVWPEIERLIASGTIDSHVENNGPPYPGALRSALRKFGYLGLPQH
jgi:hypothetical protein